jgi:hypothetical protein
LHASIADVLIEPKIAGASIVLVGNFNPAIFSPDWFIRHGLVNEQAVQRDDPDFIVHPQIAQFKLDWCQIVAETGKFSISSSKDPLVLIMDLAVRTFSEFLPHTPLRQLGINRQVHFQVASPDVRDAIGFRLAPPDAWGEWGAHITASSNQKRGGLRSLTMQQQVFDDDRSGHISTTVQPSSQITPGLGIYVQVNDHFEATEQDPARGTREIVTLLEDRFETSLSNSDSIIDQIMRLADEYAR